LFRRSDVDKDIDLVVLRHQVRVLERQLHRRATYRPVDRAVLAASAGCSLGTGGELSSSRRGRCSVGTEKPGSESGERGGAGEARAVQR
jgi:hypothetical protein